MKYKALIVSALMLLVVAFVSSPIWATEYDVGINNATDVVGGINTANKVVNFDPTEEYEEFSVTINPLAQYLTLNGNGATIRNSGGNAFVIDNTVGVTINNFNIIIGSGGNGVRGSGVTNATITNCKMSNGRDGINLFASTVGTTITNNKFTNMSRNAISLVDHNSTANLGDEYPSSYIANNKISNVEFGMFIGGNFKGTIEENKICGATSHGIQFVGRASTSNGNVSVTLTNNKIKSNNIGIAFDTHNFAYLKLDGNSIQGNNKCVALNSSATFTQLIVTNNYFWDGFGDLVNFYLKNPNGWDNNYFNGNPFP